MKVEGEVVQVLQSPHVEDHVENITRPSMQRRTHNPANAIDLWHPNGFLADDVAACAPQLEHQLAAKPKTASFSLEKIPAR